MCRAHREEEDIQQCLLSLRQNPLSFSLPPTPIPLFTIRTIHVIKWDSPLPHPTALRITYVSLCVSPVDVSVRLADNLSPSLSPSLLIRDI